MGRKKKLRTAAVEVDAIVAYELNQWNARKQAKKFNELLRKGIIVVDRGVEDCTSVFDGSDINWITT